MCSLSWYFLAITVGRSLRTQDYLASYEAILVRGLRLCLLRAIGGNHAAENHATKTTPPRIHVVGILVVAKFPRANITRGTILRRIKSFGVIFIPSQNLAT
jgi:hypothetical protein